MQKINCTSDAYFREISLDCLLNTQGLSVYNIQRKKYDEKCQTE